MNTPESSQQNLKAHLIKATHQWCVDMGYTPYMAVLVDSTVRVPAGYVQNHTIVLNTSYDSTNRFTFGEHFIEFQARFNGVVHMVGFPYNRVMKVYAREVEAGYDAVDAELIEAIKYLENGEELPTSSVATADATPDSAAMELVHSEPAALTEQQPETDDANAGALPAAEERPSKSPRKTTLKRIK